MDLDQRRVGRRKVEVRVLSGMETQLCNWRRLLDNPANHYKNIKLKLQGFENPQTDQDLCLIVRDKKPTVLYLIETKLDFLLILLEERAELHYYGIVMKM